MDECRVQIRPADLLGPIKPLNGVGGGPVTYSFSYDASDAFREAKIPFCRTHDIEYPFGSGEYVDIHNLFPDFSKDENDPANYNFILTDEYVRRILQVGAQPLFRLGSSVEHQPIKRYIYPPADFEKWARICSKIVAHYNEGWADGMYADIRYWEIWNEPDIENCWLGTEEQILALYAAAATVIKTDHPHVKVGGLAFARASAPLAERWLGYCRDHRIPVDFLSWHGYVRDPQKTAQRAQLVRELLDRYGFFAAESVYDEWNYVLNWNEGLQRSFDFHKTVGEAAFIGAVMVTAQENAVDAACYYDAQMLMERVWNGLFEPGPRSGHRGGKTVRRLKGYYPFAYWGQLLQAGRRTRCSCDRDDLYAAAALNEAGDRLYLFVSHYADTDGDGELLPSSVRLQLDGAAPLFRPVSARLTDPFVSDATVLLSGGTLDLNGFAVALITFERTGNAG